MNVTILAINDKSGGGVRVLRQLGQCLVGKGHKVTFIFSNKSGSKFFNNKNVKIIYPIERNFKNNFFHIISIFYSIIYCRIFFSKSRIIISDPFYMLFIWLLLGCKVHRFSQADDALLFENNFKQKSGIFYSFFNYLFKKFEWLGSNFPYEKIYFSNNYLKKLFLNRYPQKRIVKRVEEKIIYPRVEDIFFKKQHDTYTKDSEKKTIGAILRLHPSKRAKDFINLISISDLKKYKFKAIAFEDELSFVQDLVGSIIDENKIELKTAPSDEQLANFYGSLDYFISTSEFEGFGLPALEAMASGSIVIAAENDGILSFAKNQFNALIYSSGDVQYLKKIIEKIDDDDNLKKLIGYNAVQTAKDFSVKTMINQSFDF